jgi:hypothetical protein
MVEKNKKAFKDSKRSEKKNKKKEDTDKNKRTPTGKWAPPSKNESNKQTINGIPRFWLEQTKQWVKDRDATPAVNVVIPSTSSASVAGTSLSGMTSMPGGKTTSNNLAIANDTHSIQLAMQGLMNLLQEGWLIGRLLLVKVSVAQEPFDPWEWLIAVLILVVALLFSRYRRMWMTQQRSASVHLLTFNMPLLFSAPFLTLTSCPKLVYKDPMDDATTRVVDLRRRLVYLNTTHGMPIIFDTGASVSVSLLREDFIGKLDPPLSDSLKDRRMKGKWLAQALLSGLSTMLM